MENIDKINGRASSPLIYDDNYPSYITEEDTKHPKLNLFPPLNFATQNTNLKFNFALTK